MRHAPAVVAGIGLLGGAAHAATQPQVWQGSAFVKSVTPACTAALVAAAGDYNLVVYRPLIAGSPANIGNEGLTFLTPRSALHYFTPDNSSQSFRTAGTANIVQVGSHASDASGTGAYSLHFSPASPTLTSPTVTITGSLNNFWNVPGCNVTITAALDRRIN